MTINKNTNFLIVGLGLMGGSYAMALKRKGYRVESITLSQKSIDYAMNKGIIDRGSVSVEPEIIKRADIVVFALYPHVFEEWISKYGDLFNAGTIITDVTGVKSSVVYKIQSMLKNGVEFIPAHPMAGREVYGVENATDSIFKEANYIVVPTAANTEQAIMVCEELGKILGFKRISRLSPEEHDKMIAFLSQLTHCIAISLMCANDDKNISKYTGDSFRDLTRIARINEEMWSELFLLNKTELISQIDAFSAQLCALRNAIENDDAEVLKEMMKESTERRKLFDAVQEGKTL